MYINFGSLGVFGVSFLLGIVFRYLSVRFWHRPPDASAYAFGMVLGLPLFLIESNLSMMVGQLVISTISLIIFGYLAAILYPQLFLWRPRVQ